jgi:hypothetical protein
VIVRRSGALGQRRSIAVVVVLAAILLAACGQGSATPSVALIPVSGQVLAGPTCPVERDPPDPACAPRPVQGARLHIVSATTGAVVAEVTTDAAGTYAAVVPPGAYRLEGVDGMPGFAPPEPVPFEAVDGAGPLTVDLEVDTGIR